MRSSNEQKELDRLWADPANWTPSGFYRCEADPRVWVLKRGNGIGYTINVAHERSSVIFFGVVLIAIAPTLISLALGPRAPSWFLLVQLLVPIAVVVIMLVWLSTRRGN